MDDGTPNSLLKPGETLGPVHADPSTLLKPGETLGAVQSSAQPSASSQREPTVTMGGTGFEDVSTEKQPGVLGTIQEQGAHAALGVAKGGMETAQGVAKLAHLPVPAEGMDTSAEGTAEQLGKLAEVLGEFAAGDAAVSGLAKMMKVAKIAPDVIKLAEKYPKTAKMLMGAGKGAAVGGTQGAVKGAAEGKAGEGAEAGAAGGAIGGAAAEAIPAGIKSFAKIIGLPSTSEQAMTKAAAGSLRVGTQNWAANLQKALPLIAEENKLTPMKTVGDFEELVHTAANKLWTETVQPQVERHATEMIEPSALGAKVRSVISRSMAKLNPEEAEAVEKLAGRVEQPMTVQDTNEDLMYLNARLQKFYKSSPESRAAIFKTDGEVAATESLADGLRDTLYAHLEAAGEQTPREFREQYGALKEVQKVFGKRAVVADRQLPLSLRDSWATITAIGEMATAIASGHPQAALGGIPIMAANQVIKHLNAPATLLKTGMKLAAKEAAGAGPSATKAAIGATGKLALPALGANMLRIWSGGGIHDIPADKLDEATQLDPNLRVIQGGEQPQP